ncbi:hypothetical protein BASA81_011300 [Batrachochytrium salamandrivorans]|nr:hypothetical protein BASA81_011300 [Batrachochytrium salamandrivorans]
MDAKKNKFTAFTLKERDALGLRGLLPVVVETQHTQMLRELALLRSKSTDLERYLHLMALLQRNERLFYFLVLGNPEETVPLVYTPVVGEACVKYSQIYTQINQGLFVSLRDVGNVGKLFDNYVKHRGKDCQIKAIVVTDGERILGLGDQGCNGMGIPVGKLQLYVAMGGIHPHHTLPVTLDVGTNNQSLLDDPLYIGLKQPRERGEKYDQLVHEFVTQVKAKFGNQCLIQWEDFGNQNAFRLLDKYRDQQLSFNDDIQGTAAVVLAAVLSSLKITANTQGGAQMVCDHTLVFFGAGEAGVGIANLIAEAIATAKQVTKQEARAHIWLVDKTGLVHSKRLDGLRDDESHKSSFAHELSESVLNEFAGEFTNLEATCRILKATGLIGVSAQPNTFTKQVCEQMASNCKRPLIFALSNPTSKAECTAEQAIQWTQGQCLFCSGSPFPNVQYQGKSIKIGQANNSYIFPGLALGLLSVEMSSVPNKLLEVCAQALASTVTLQDLEQGSLFPPLSAIRKVSAEIATQVAQCGYELGLARLHPKPANLLEHCQAAMYSPEY